MHVAHERADLIPWYQKLGFKIIGTAPWPADNVWMLKRPMHFLHFQKLVSEIQQ